MLEMSQVRQLSVIQPGRAEARALLEWLAIALLVFAQVHLLAFWTYPLVALLIASRQHALLVLMHEAAHYRISRSRRWNDLFGEAVCWPLFVSMRGYRRHHIKHHVAEALNTADDPDFERKQRRAPKDWTFPMPRRHLARLLLRDVTLLNTHEYLAEAEDAGNAEGASRAYNAARLGFVFIYLGAITWLGGWRLFALYWLLPMLTWLKAILRLRSIADHFAVRTERGAFAQTRTIVAPWWERFLLAPAAIGVHGPHHAYASIPYYRLRRAHEALMQIPDYQRTAVISPSYRQAVLVELCP